MEISPTKIKARLAKLEEALQRVARQQPQRKGFALASWSGPRGTLE